MADIDFTKWTQAVENLNWGVQAAVKDALHLAAQGKITLCYGKDYSEDSPCLINAIRNMLPITANETPSQKFPGLVGAFDHINYLMHLEMGLGFEYRHKVSTDMAESLLDNMPTLKKAPTEEVINSPVEDYDWPEVPLGGPDAFIGNGGE